MKVNVITISTTNNGYLVDASRSGSPYDQHHLQNWTFESMKELQERLPEILDIPVEKRQKEKD